MSTNRARQWHGGGGGGGGGALVQEVLRVARSVPQLHSVFSLNVPGATRTRDETTLSADGDRPPGN